MDKIEALSQKVKELGGDIFLITQTLKEVQAENERLFNRIKCLECGRCFLKERDVYTPIKVNDPDPTFLK